MNECPRREEMKEYVEELKSTRAATKDGIPDQFYEEKWTECCRGNVEAAEEDLGGEERTREVD